EKKINTELKRNNYKLTDQRRAVIASIIACQTQFTPASIYESVHQTHPDIGVVTVYRTLGILVELGLVCELHTSGDYPTYTVGMPEHHHHHLVCNRCGKVVDFTGHSLAELEEKLAKESGFRIDNHILEFTGLCLSCQRGASD
ncbi:MAG: transcriptional repressor, partial [Dehalococcoidales bacterium]|nr:transcriptional repressor [Dehalococcoidales bacterium]